MRYFVTVHGSMFEIPEESESSAIYYFRRSRGYPRGLFRMNPEGVLEKFQYEDHGPGGFISKGWTAMLTGPVDEEVRAYEEKSKRKKRKVKSSE